MSTTIPVLDRDNNVIAVVIIEDKITVNLFDTSKKHAVEKLIKNIYGLTLEWKNNVGEGYNGNRN